MYLKTRMKKRLYKKGQHTRLKKAYRKDVAYFALLNAALGEWLSAYDEEAYSDL
jgi:hypothetical protein